MWQRKIVNLKTLYLYPRASSRKGDEAKLGKEYWRDYYEFQETLWWGWCRKKNCDTEAKINRVKIKKAKKK